MRSPGRWTSTSTTSRSARTTTEQPVFLKDIWPTEAEVQRDDRGGGPVRHVPHELRRGVRGRRAVGVARGPDRRLLPVGRAVDLCPPPAVLRGAAARAGADLRHRRRASAGGARRQRHHRPHLPGRLDQARQPGREIPDRARRRAQGLQLLRLAARQPRGDDARHVREHPPAQPARPGDRGRRDHLPGPGRRGGRAGAPDLRGRDAVSRGEHPAGGARGQGVRIGLIARLGREGHPAARRSAP